MSLDVVRLDSEQLAVVSFDPERPLLIHAGAGSGKTRTLTSRVARLITEGVSPHSMLILTFTRKSAEMLRQRVQEVLPPPVPAHLARSLHIKTTHSFGLSLLRERGGAIGLPPDFAVADRGKVRLMIHAVLIKMDLRHISPLLVDAYITERKLRLWSDTGAMSDPKGLEPIFVEYQKAMAAERCIDFGDILLSTLTLLRDDPVVRCDVRRRFRYVLVDEVQDLSDIQRDIILLLAGDSMRLSCVGDPNQSIYGWRGACRDIYADLKRRVVQPEALPLSTNYRSVPQIVDTSSRFIGTKATAHRPQTTTAGVSNQSAILLVEHHSELDELQHHARLLRAWHSSTPWHEMAVLVRTQQQRAVVSHFLATAGLIPCRGGGRRSAASRNAYPKACLALLRLAVDPSDLDATKTVFTMPKCHGASTNVLWTLTTLAEASRMSLFEFFKLLCASDFNVGLTGGAKLNAAVRNRLTSVVRTVEATRSAVHEGRDLSDILRVVLTASGLEDHARQHALSEAMKRSKRAVDSSDDECLFDPAELLQAHGSDEKAAQEAAAGATFHALFHAIESLRAQGIDLRGDAALLRLQDEFADIAESDVHGPDHESAKAAVVKDAVSVLTVHAAKGLEWSRVIVHRVNNTEFPCSVRPGDPEERRVFYVALTRAKDALVISSLARGVPRTVKHGGGGGPSASPPQSWNDSPYVDELRKILDSTST